MAGFHSLRMDGSQCHLPSIFKVHHVSAGKSNTTVSMPPSLTTRASIIALQSQLPSYGETPLKDLPEVATKHGLSKVFVKDESQRFGLSSFKILGASWSIYRALCEELDLASSGEPSLAMLRDALRGLDARGEGLTLVACSAGNWGRACARMAAVLGLRAIILLPKQTEEVTARLIDGEGTTVTAKVVNVSYDAAVKMAEELSRQERHFLVMDTSWDDYTKIPTWVTEGYSVMLDEVEDQVRQACGKRISTVVVSVGVGSWAQAVVQRYKSETAPHDVQVIAVEPERAACLMTSLHDGKAIPIRTERTIMNGMNCGVVSKIAWPDLSLGTDVAVAVADEDVDKKVKDLEKLGICIGPCGAATFVALDLLAADDLLGKDNDAATVLFSTEGPREYVL